jgi:hypothetical protein
MTAASQIYWETPPTLSDLASEHDTDCVGWYPATDDSDAYQCTDGSTCPLCDGFVCKEHDDVTQCDGDVVHQVCHAAGCWSTACAKDHRDDDILARDEERRGR